MPIVGHNKHRTDFGHSEFGPRPTEHAPDGRALATGSRSILAYKTCPLAPVQFRPDLLGANSGFHQAMSRR